MKLPLAIGLLAALILPLSGCATAEEDRGAWGDNRAGTQLQIGAFYGDGWRPSTAQTLDSQTVATGDIARIDAEIAKLTAAREAAEAAAEPNEEAIEAFATQIESLEKSKAAAQKAKGGQSGGSVVVNVSGNITLTVAGDMKADTSGATDQKPSNAPKAEIPVSIVPK